MNKYMSGKFIIATVFALLLSLLPLGNVTHAFEQLPKSLAYEVIDRSSEYILNDLYYYEVLPGETVNMSLTIKNRSKNPVASVWYGKSSIANEGSQYPNAHAIGLGTANPRDNVPGWVDPSSLVINGNRLMYYDGERVDHNRTVTLNFQLKVAASAAVGEYSLYLAPVREFDEWGERVTSTGLRHQFQDILWKFKVTNIPGASVQTYAKQGGDFTFNYPSDWKITGDNSIATGNYVQRILMDKVVGGDPSDDPVSVLLVRNAGTSIDEAIQIYLNSLANVWNAPSISLQTKTSEGRDYKHVVITSKDGKITMVSDFIISQHNFVVQVNYDNKTAGIGTVITNSVK